MSSPGKRAGIVKNSYTSIDYRSGEGQTPDQVHGGNNCHGDDAGRVFAADVAVFVPVFGAGN
jgi:hypothetical protein